MFNDILEHPSVNMMKDRLALKEALKFDPTDWTRWKALYGFAYIGNHDRHYSTYGGGPEGGIRKSYGGGGGAGTLGTEIGELDQLIRKYPMNWRL